MRKLLIVFSLLPIGTFLWSSVATAWECDPAISRGTCSGSGQKYPAFDRLAVRDPVSSKRILVDERIRRDDYAGARPVRLEQTGNPTSARDTPLSGTLLAMNDELSTRQGGLDTSRAGGQLLSSRDGLRVSRAESDMPDVYPANHAVQTGRSRPQPSVNATTDGGAKVSPASSSMSPASQPGSGTLLIAGLLGIYAVARRRISSILG